MATELKNADKAEEEALPKQRTHDKKEVATENKDDDKLEQAPTEEKRSFTVDPELERLQARLSAYQSLKNQQKQVAANPDSSPVDKTSAPQKDGTPEVNSDLETLKQQLARYQALKNQQDAVASDPESSPLEKAQANQRAGLLNAALLQGASKIAQGMAMKYGGNPGDNLEGVKSVQEMARQPVQDYIAYQKNLDEMASRKRNDAVARMDLAKAVSSESANMPMSKEEADLAAHNFRNMYPNEPVPDFTKTTRAQAAPYLKGGSAAALLTVNSRTRKFYDPVAKQTIEFAYNNATHNYDRPQGVVNARDYRVDPADNTLKRVTPEGLIPLQNVSDPYGGATAKPATPSKNAIDATQGQGPLSPSKVGNQPLVKKEPYASEVSPTISDYRTGNADLGIKPNLVVAKQIGDISKEMLRNKTVNAVRDAMVKETNLNTKLKLLPDGSVDPEVVKNPEVTSLMAGSVRAQIAALSLGAAPTKDQIVKAVGDESVGGQLWRVYEKLLNNQMSVDDYQVFANYADTMHKAIAQQAKNATQIFVNRVKQQDPRLNDNQALSLLGGNIIPDAPKKVQFRDKSTGQVYNLDSNDKNIASFRANKKDFEEVK